MERLHWVRHCCRQLLAAGTGRGCYSAPDVMVAKRRSVFARHGPRQHEHRSTCRGLNTNAIRTTKYSLLTFVPLNLFQQFHRAANLYFLFLALLNWVPVVEAFQKEITMVPLLVVLTVIAIKDVMEDYRRYVFDKKVNNKVVQVFCGKDKRYVEQCWKDVQVGDFVRLTCNEVIPADMLLLDSSDPRRLCYVETANLDGESNLKQRQVVCELPLHGGGVTPENFHGRIECEKPNDDLSRFRGFIENTSGTRIGLHTNNLLLRSCIIRNTEAVVGVVVYAGHDTKAMMNNSGPRSKRSRLERQLNTHVLWCVLLLVLLCLTAAVGHGFWLKELKDPPFLLDADTSPALAAFYVFWTMIIVLQVLIPISLYVSIEIVKLGQVYFIQNDIDLYNQRLDSRIQCRTLNITEDLGQIQYLFSDKTGTLTENQMVFRRCSIFGVEYPHLENMRRSEVKQLDRTGAAACPPTLTSVCSRPSLSCGSASCGSCSAAEDGIQPRTQAFSSHVTKEVVADPELVRKLSRLSSPVLSTSAVSSEASLELTYITDFFLALTICNSVVVSPPPSSDTRCHNCKHLSSLWRKSS